MATTGYDKFHDRLEPELRGYTFPTDVAVLSLAISTKRIADALERIAGQFDLDQLRRNADR